MARDDPQINIRLPAGLKDRLERSAAINNRSTTAEIVERLNRSFHEQKLPPKLIVRLEVLRQGPAIDVPVLDFFRSMSQTLRDQISAQLAEDREARRIERAGIVADTTLEPPADWAEDDDAVVEKAAKDVAEQRAARMRRAARKREAKDDEPDE